MRASEAIEMTIETLKLICAGTKSVLALLGGFTAVALVALAIAVHAEKPDAHNQKWFYDQVCPHAHATWAYTAAHRPPQDPDNFFDFCVNEMKDRK